MVCHQPGGLQVGQHHLHAVLRAAPGLGALGRDRVILEQGDERQDVRKRGVAQWRAFCRETQALKRLWRPLLPPAAPETETQKGKGWGLPEVPENPRLPTPGQTFPSRFFQLNLLHLWPGPRATPGRADTVARCRVSARTAGPELSQALVIFLTGQALPSPGRVETWARSPSNMGRYLCPR